MIDIDKVIEDINCAIKFRADELNEEIEKSIAYEFLSGDVPAYEVDHSCDPPWDWSGHLVQDGYIEARSTLFEEYLEMYTGSSYPSFCSGCGMFHRRNREDIDEMITSWAFDIQSEIVSKYVSEVDKCELYSWLMKNKYQHYVDAKTCEDFIENFDEYKPDIYGSIVDFLDGDTIAFYDYEIAELLSVFKNNPLISDIIKDHKKETIAEINRDKREAERQRLIASAVRKDLDMFVAILKERLPDTNAFFKGRRITREKENGNLRKAFFEKFTRDEVALIAYFESYRFSNSMIADLPKDVERMIEAEKARLRSIYEQKYPQEVEL